MAKTRRIRDPIYGFIVFDEKNETDMLAWELIETPEFQRLRRIKQLGVSDFVFPSATHSRFAHSLGVYHNARMLMKIIRREEGGSFDENRANVILIAALLHDIGHGPFSHAFEDARKAVARHKGQSKAPSHEKFTENLILDKNGAINKILEASKAGLSQDVADIFAIDNPADIYHAVVSSSFDADRLDYLMRDRYMTGTGAGAIDRDWLIENLKIYKIYNPDDPDDPDNTSGIPTFTFKAKARQAAEDFLLARHRLYTQVYLHKTTRGFEKLATALFVKIGDPEICPNHLGLDKNAPLVRFLRDTEASLDDYKRLDDAAVWSAIEVLTRSQDDDTCRLAKRLFNREPPRVLDLAAHFSDDKEAFFNAENRLDNHLNSQLGTSVFKDSPGYNLYTTMGGESEKEHKKVRVHDGNGAAKEITAFKNTIIGEPHQEKARLLRYYFLDDEIYREARDVMDGR